VAEIGYAWETSPSVPRRHSTQPEATSAKIAVLEKKCGAVYRWGAQTVAKEGYVDLPVHYFDRTGVTEVAPKNIKKADFMDWMDTVRAAVAYARHSGVGVKRVGLLGFSLGACLSLALSSAGGRAGGCHRGLVRKSAKGATARL
jgi:dienelactone hydrolase